MTYMSPFLRNHTTQPSNKTQLDKHHERIYQDLQEHANDVKPNEAKAKLVQQNPITGAVSAVVDTGKDCVNFAKAVTTGKLSDNNLGRINDLGMKAGALLIATFFASHAKTKTDKIMQFIGGGTFIAAMSLWPKLFINLPARLVHGFRIDQKYINAQGDKKDFFLDNHFIPWDAYPIEDLKKIGKRTGIDYDSENGEEKIKRKMQKTALQNRTLWMATAGFATPLMTAMVGNAVQPKIKDMVVERDFKKAKDILSDEKKLGAYLEKNAESIVMNESEIDSILKNFSGTDTDFRTLGDKLQISEMLKTLMGDDEAKLLQTFKSDGMGKELISMYEEQSKFTVPEGKTFSSILEKAMSELGVGAENSMASLFEEVSETDYSKPAKDIIDAMGDDLSIKKLKEVCQNSNINFENLLDKIKELSKEEDFKGIEIDSSKFAESVKNFNKGPLAQARGRIKAYIELANSVVGSTAESKATKEITGIVENYAKLLGFDYKNLKEIKKGDELAMQSKLVDFFKAKANSQDYDKFLDSLFVKTDDGFADAMTQIISESNTETVANVKNGGGLLKAVLGGDFDEQKGLKGILSNFINSKKADIDSIRLRGVWCAELEKMIADGKLQGDEEIAAARDLLYRGTISSIYNNAEAFPKAIDKVKKLLRNSDNYSKKAKEIDGFVSYIETMAEKVFKDNSAPLKDRLNDALKNNLCPNFAARIKETMTGLFNNKTWMKRFGTMSAVLVGITLLVQPFFGNIKKEYSDNKQGGAN